MTINCLPNSGTDIKVGFNCTISGDLSQNSATLISIDGTPTTYVENYWTNGELIMSFFLFLILMFEIIKFGWEFFFPKIMRIKKTK